MPLGMRRCRINLPNRCCRLISRVAHRAFEGGQAANRKSYAAMTRKTYCGNLLWQSGLTLLVARRMARFLNRKSQRYYRLKFADTYYGEMTHYGLYCLAWADVRRAR